MIDYLSMTCKRASKTCAHGFRNLKEGFEIDTCRSKDEGILTLIYSMLIFSILSWVKSSHGDNVMMEKTIKRAWKAVSFDNSDIC